MTTIRVPVVDGYSARTFATNVVSPAAAADDDTP